VIAVSVLLLLLRLLLRSQRPLHLLAGTFVTLKTTEDGYVHLTTDAIHATKRRLVKSYAAGAMAEKTICTGVLTVIAVARTQVSVTMFVVSRSSENGSVATPMDVVHAIEKPRVRSCAVVVMAKQTTCTVVLTVTAAGARRREIAGMTVHENAATRGFATNPLDAKHVPILTTFAESSVHAVV